MSRVGGRPASDYLRAMADGFTLEIDADMAERIERRAGKSGVSREDAARMLLEQQLFDL